jgi:hypothetical protein
MHLAFANSNFLVHDGALFDGDTLLADRHVDEAPGPH